VGRNLVVVVAIKAAPQGRRVGRGAALVRGGCREGDAPGAADRLVRPTPSCGGARDAGAAGRLVRPTPSCGGARGAAVEGGRGLGLGRGGCHKGGAPSSTDG
jgi:hypothetical protein